MHEPATPELLYGRTSVFQKINLFREADGSLSLTLDDFWQFSSRDEYIFHEVLVDTAMITAPEPRRVLVLGGGDGLALRNVLRYPEVERAVLCELDPQVLEMTQTVPQLVALSERSLCDPRVQVVTDDALRYLRRCDERFDVVICDFPVPTGPEIARLFDTEFYRILQPVLTPSAVVSVQVSLEPLGFWPVLQATESVFAWAEPRLAALADDVWADFILCSDRPRDPCRELAPESRFLTSELVRRLAIRNRSGERFETVHYGVEPDFSEWD